MFDNKEGLEMRWSRISLLNNQGQNGRVIKVVEFIKAVMFT